MKQLGGLQVIGTERHEAQRIDQQLRGRAGRQGEGRWAWCLVVIFFWGARDVDPVQFCLFFYVSLFLGVGMKCIQMQP